MAKIVHRRPHAAARRPEYPPLTEFADAYYWACRGKPEKMQAYLAKVDQVKAKYPKPENGQ